MPLPIPNLDTKNFDDFFEEARAALPALAPEWTDYNLSDPGITLLELFSWLNDINMYRLNRIDRKHILKYLKLLDASPLPVYPAKLWITFQNDATGVIMAGTKISSDDKENNITIPFVTKQEVSLQQTKLSQINLKNERGLFEYQDPFPKFFYPFGQIAKKGHYFDLTYETSFNSDFSLTFIFYEDDLPNVGHHDKEVSVVFPSAALVWKYWDGEDWSDLQIEKDDTNSLSQNGTVFFKGSVEVSKIRCKIEQYHFENAPRIQAVLTNTTEAVQIEEHRELFEKAGTGLPKQRLQLKVFPLVSLDIKIAGEIWEETDTLEIFEHDSKVFKVDKNTIA